MTGTAPSRSENSPRQLWLTLAAMTLAGSMILVDQTAVPMAIAEIMDDLNGPLAQTRRRTGIPYATALFNRKGSTMDLRLELVVIPVSDVDRAKAFYVDQFGFHADHDHVVTPELRFVQLTPPGSACSIAFGIGLTDTAPGSVKGLQVVTTDIEDTQRQLRERGLDPGEIENQAWGRFLHIEDPDGNHWAIQQIVRAGA